MSTRRTLLALLGSAAGLGALGGLGAQVSTGPVRGWTPAPDTWPRSGYGPANTAAASAASPPADPGVDWRAGGLGPVDRGGIAVGTERVYAAGDGMVALDRADGATAWDLDVAAGPVALRAGTVYTAAAEAAGADAATPVRAVEAATGTVAWRRAGVGEARSVLPTGGAVYVGGEGGLVSLRAGDGGRRWRDRGGPLQGALPLLRAGRLYAAGRAAVGYRPRSLLDATLGGAPPRAWETGTAGTPVAVAATPDRLVVGSFIDRTEAGPALRCLALADGSEEWTHLAAPAGPASVGGLAVDGGRCYVGLERGDEAAVVALSLSDGRRLWRRPVAGEVVDLAVAGDHVLLVTAADRVHALDAAEGRRRWALEVFEPRALAPVEGAVFVLTERGFVVALR